VPTRSSACRSTSSISIAVVVIWCVSNPWGACPCTGMIVPSSPSFYLRCFFLFIFLTQLFFPSLRMVIAFNASSSDCHSDRFFGRSQAVPINFGSSRRCPLKRDFFFRRAPLPPAFASPSRLFFVCVSLRRIRVGRGTVSRAVEVASRPVMAQSLCFFLLELSAPLSLLLKRLTIT